MHNESPTTQPSTILRFLRQWYVLLFLPPLLIVVNAAAEHEDIATSWIHLDSDDVAQSTFIWRERDGEANVEKSEVYFFGNSATREAIDLDIVSAHINRPAYSFALTSVRLSELPRVPIPLDKGDTLVIGINPPFVDDRAKRNTSLDPYNDDISPYLIRHRASIAKVIEVRLQYWAARAMGQNYRPYRAGDLARQYRYEGRSRRTQAVLDSYRRCMLEELKIDAADHAHEDVDALDAIVNDYRSRGVDVVLLLLPDVLPYDVARRYDNGVQRTLKEAQRLGIPVIDARSIDLPEQDYYDFGHLLKEGRRKFSNFVAVELERIMKVEGGTP